MRHTADQPAQHQPIFNVPTGVVWLLALLAAIHVARLLLPAELDGWLIGATAFIPARYADPESVALPFSPYADYTSWITHMLIHGSVLHLMFNAAWLLAFGGAVANRIGPTRAIAFAAICGIAGALVFLLWHWGQLVPMVGASGAISGLMGASLRFLFPALDRGHGSLRNINYYVRTTPLMPLTEAIRDRRVVLTTVMLVVLNVIAVFGFGPGPSDGPIAWEAHAGGFAAGFFLYGLFDSAMQNDEPIAPDFPISEDEGKPTLH